MWSVKNWSATLMGMAMMSFWRSVPTPPSRAGHALEDESVLVAGF